MALYSAISTILQERSIAAVILELSVLMIPVWIALFVGVLFGWAWRPDWANLLVKFLDTSEQSPSVNSTSSAPVSNQDQQRKLPPSEISSSSMSSRSAVEKFGAVNRDDLEHLCRLVEVKDGGPAWIQMMDKFTPTMSYKAWRRDPPAGPPQYRSRTVFEDAAADLVRDYFWDDEFRQKSKWDDMLLQATILEECQSTGTLVVQWVRKFPFFCSDREYIIGRSIWQSGQSYYCVTKGVPCTSVPRRDKPRRVDLYYSSWCIRPVESNRGDGQLTACEVLLFHHEDMGIPWEIAKLGIRQGMWGAVKKIEPGLRAYQKERASGAPLSQTAAMARLNTKVSEDYLSCLESISSNGETSSDIVKTDCESPKNKLGNNMSKLLVFGGAVVLACSLDRGLLEKLFAFGAARRFGQIGRKQ